MRNSVVIVAILAATTIFADTGAEIFQSVCASCHGKTGRGDGPAAAALNPPPKDLMKSKLNRRSVYRTIRDGSKKSPLMAAYKGVLSDAQIKKVTKYVMSLRKKD